MLVVAEVEGTSSGTLGSGARGWSEDCAAAACAATSSSLRCASCASWIAFNRAACRSAFLCAIPPTLADA